MGKVEAEYGIDQIPSLKGFLQFILVLQALKLYIHSATSLFGVGIMNSVSEILFVKYKLAIFGITEGKEKKKRRIYSCK